MPIRPNRELVVYAVYILGGDRKRIHTEDVALKCFELYPSSFSWVKYREYPDKDIVRVALTDARKEKYGALVEGRSGQKMGQTVKTNRAPTQDGWMLTSAGVTWIQDNINCFAGSGESSETREHRQRLLKQLKRIRSHHLFAQFEDSPTRFFPKIGDIADLLRCRVDAEPEIWHERIKNVRVQAMSAGQEDVVLFIKRCEDEYKRQR